MSQTAMVSEARAWQRGQESSARPFLLMKPSLIKAKDNYFPLFVLLGGHIISAACIFFDFSLSLFLFTASSCLHHMAADQMMSNILPLQVFAICSFQTWDLLKAGVIMGMLYPPSFLSHRISLQLMLQRESHVITLAFRRCPHERGRGKRRQ